MPAQRKAQEPLHHIRNDILYTEGANLPAVEPREGFTQRWVRARLINEDDDKNIYKRQQQGWEPRKYSTIPKGIRLPKTNFDGLDVVGMKEMILMERPIELDQQYTELRRRDSQRQHQAVVNDVNKYHDAESGSNKRSKIESGVDLGRTPAIADD